MKAGKDPTKTTGYRPTTLTSHPGKVMERMTVDRLMYVTERRQLFAPSQQGEEHHGPSSLLESEMRKAQCIRR